ncbi:MAG: SoxR reducing system RseC family protein [Gammaproteobacteria bacterium]|nr:SoxR reducing system RseC family protein [Gammaproteobacteria bacterium]MYB36168.1 SoxR reducing system RseC family protein [Gammaproteobacteria bacterium]
MRLRKGTASEASVAPGLGPRPRPEQQNMKDMIRTGTVERSAAGTCRVRLDDATCAGCSGRCGVGFRAPRTVIDVPGDAAVGARVEVQATCAAFVQASGLVFGLPLGMVAVGMLAVAAFDLAEGWLMAALVGGLALALGLSRRFAEPSATLLRKI